MKNNNGRRNFLSWLTGLGSVAFLGSIIYPAYKFIVPPESGEANVSQVKLPFTRSDINSEEKKAKTFKFGRKLGIIILTGEGELKAMAATCTHLDCTVQYKTDTQQIWCACHNGLYDMQGNNISGPPPKPLTNFTVVIKNDKVFISREDIV